MPGSSRTPAPPRPENPHPLRVVLTVARVVSRRILSRIVGVPRRGLNACSDVLLRARRTSARRSTPLPGDARGNPRRIVVPPETRALVGAVGRRLALLAALAVLVVCGGDLAAARAADPVLHGPILFMMAFAVCGGVCLIAPERRLRWSGMLVGAANGAFAAATYFATQM